jgi:hypothetical protein
MAHLLSCLTSTKNNFRETCPGEPLLIDACKFADHLYLRRSGSLKI